jgi:hypothetical protein
MTQIKAPDLSRQLHEGTHEKQPAQCALDIPQGRMAAEGSKWGLTQSRHLESSLIT